jgi:pilus assembly protein Flp/PilA
MCRETMKRLSKEKNYMNSIVKFIRDEEGLTTVEYAIAGGLVGAGVIAAFGLLGDEVFRVINAIYLAVSTIQIN